jgi:hypothetical protein
MEHKLPLAVVVEDSPFAREGYRRFGLGCAGSMAFTSVASGCCACSALTGCWRPSGPEGGCPPAQGLVSQVSTRSE